MTNTQVLVILQGKGILVVADLFINILVTYEGKNMLSALNNLKKSGLVFGFVFMAMIMLTGCGGEDAELKKNIQSTVDGMQQLLPMKFGEDVTLSEVKADGSRIVYFYSLSNVSLEEQKLEASQLEVMKNTTYEAVIVGVCASADTKKILTVGGGLEYIYNDVDGKEIMKFTINKDDCE